MKNALYTESKFVEDTLKWKRSTLLVGPSGTGKTTGLAAGLVKALRNAVERNKRVRPIMLLLPEWGRNEPQWCDVETLLKLVFGQYYGNFDFRNYPNESDKELPDLLDYAACKIAAFRMNAADVGRQPDGYVEVLEWLQRCASQNPILVMDEPSAIFRESLSAFMKALPAEVTLLWATPTIAAIPREHLARFSRLTTLRVNPLYAKELLNAAQYLGGKQAGEFVKAGMQLAYGRALTLKSATR